MAKASSGFAQNVFINCPFDNLYKPLFEATVFVVQIAGFTPRCALEASNAGQVRMDKIMEIIAQCQYGIHDISRTELGPGRLPRFNMPLELGLDLGCRRYGPGRLSQKRLLILDKSRHRYHRFISDIAGQDIVSHANSPRQLIRCVRDWISTESKLPEIPGGEYIDKRYRAFLRELPDLCKRMKLSLKQLTFGDFSRLVRIWLEENET
ncbi:MAG TPA: hypothetical protein VJ725_24630 [Thermoanaerobaculia bacterium]|nr:hypothetical protein [Thermoanaerobaculia bacterium]